AVETKHADLRAGKEREGDVLEDHALGRNHLAHAIHRVDVLGHRDLLCEPCGEPMIIAGREGGKRKGRPRPPFGCRAALARYFGVPAAGALLAVGVAWRAGLPEPPPSFASA